MHMAIFALTAIKVFEQLVSVTSSRIQSFDIDQTFLSVPARRTTEGFPERNKFVGNCWSSLESKEQTVFQPALFRRLAHTITHPTLPPLPPPSNNNDPRNPVDLEPYIPIFKDLVNLSRVSQDLDCNCLGKKNVNYKMKGRQEISKLVKQVQSNFIPLLPTATK